MKKFKLIWINTPIARFERDFLSQLQAPSDISPSIYYPIQTPLRSYVCPGVYGIRKRLQILDINVFILQIMFRYSCQLIDLHLSTPTLFFLVVGIIFNRRRNI